MWILLQRINIRRSEPKMKICTVPTEKAQELCPDPRIFNVCAQTIGMYKSPEEIKKQLEEWNKFCEDNKCPYLKEIKEK